MAEIKRPNSSLLKVIDEIKGLYPELDQNSIHRLFLNQSPSSEIDEKKSVVRESAEKSDDEIEIIELDISSDTSSDEDVKLIENYERIRNSEKKSTDLSQQSKPAGAGATDWKHYRTPAPVKFGKMKTFRTPTSVPTDKKEQNDAGSVAYENEFLASLSDHFPTPAVRNEEAVLFLKNFQRRKDALVHRLLKIYNEYVFKNQLPEDLSCVWNVRLTKTAGFCKYKTDSAGNRVAYIELSTKVCDNAERVRDTLIHEMCHAAAWIIYGSRGGHDSAWKYWARQAGRVFSSLPLIKRCHAYQIHAKYLYMCMTCGQQVRRHSKSLNTDLKVCGICRGRIELREEKKKDDGTGTATASKPRPTPKFALFVKSHYNGTKVKTPQASHKEIMRTLGDEFKKLDFNEGE